MAVTQALAVALAMGLCAGAAHAQAQPLNDTGITFSGDASSNSTACDVSASTVQDCHNGRDAVAATGFLTKAGASAPNNGTANGFDYTKISNSDADLPASTALGSGANDWACTRDNVTGLVWEVKTASGFRSSNDRYSWYNSSSPDGNIGTSNGGTCFNTGRCDSEKFVQDVNALGLCGHSDWRMPSRRELQSLVDYGRSGPSIDPVFFPNTASSYVWTGSPSAGDSSVALYVHFDHGDVHGDIRANNHYVRLVRGGQ